MKENHLRKIDGIKIRRQYFNGPLIFLFSLMVAIPYFIFIISLFMGKSDHYDWSSILWISVEVCFVFSLPFLILRTLNKYFFGRIICVLTKQGIHYPKGMLRYETIEKIEYVMDSKPRYKSDSAKAYRAIIYTRGSKHVVLPCAPVSILSRAKKCNKAINVTVSGACSLLSAVLIMTAILALIPFYMVLLVKAPGASLTQVIVSGVIFLVLGIVRTHVFNFYAIQYRFWRRILPRKWLSYIVLGCYYSSFFIGFLVLMYFPNWIVTVLFGMYLGIVQPPIPSRTGMRTHKPMLSYERLYDIYINKADFWKKKIEKSSKK